MNPRSGRDRGADSFVRELKKQKQKHPTSNNQNPTWRRQRFRE
jgi:hypothetical protein